MNEEAIEKKFNLANKILDKNPNADVSTLIALDDEKSTSMSVVKAYVFSVILSPLGVYYFFKLYFFEEEKKAAIICLVLTIIVLLIEIKLFGGMFSNTPSLSNPYNFSGM